MSHDKKNQGTPGAIDAFKQAMKLTTLDGRSRSKLADLLKRLVESLVARKGKDFRLRLLPEGVYVDSDGSAIVDDSNAHLKEMAELFALAEAVEVNRWSQQALAEFVILTRFQEGSEPSEAVTGIVGCLAALSGSTARLTYDEIGARLRAKAAKISEAR